MTSPTTEELLSSMLNKPLYVALRHPGNVNRVAELLDAHLKWMVAAERRGELFASGPFVAEGAAPGSLGGMSIVRASSVDHARELLSHDPFVREGVVILDVRKWMVMEGGVTVTLRFSDRTGRLL